MRNLPYDELIEVEPRTDNVWKVIIGGVVCLDEHKDNFRNSRHAMNVAVDNYSLHLSWESEQGVKEFFNRP